MFCNKRKSSVVLTAWLCLFFITKTFAQPPQIQLTPVTSSTICNDGSNTFSFSLSGKNLPAGGQIIIYSNTDSLFNPYAGQGDSIGVVNTDAVNGTTDTTYFGSCVKTIGIFLDACGALGTEPRNEYMVLTSGNGFNVSDISIDFASQNNGTPENSDINTGDQCNFKTPEQSLITGLKAGSCDPNQIIPAPPGLSVPANALVLVFTSSDVNYTYDISGLCGKGLPIYVMQSSCQRSIGAFTNSSAACNTNPTRYRNTIVTDKAKSCSNNFLYDRCNLFDLDGTYAIRQEGTDTASVANGGILRNTLDSCGGIDFSKLQLSQDTIITLNVPVEQCNDGKVYIKAILKPGQTTSNTTFYELICLNAQASASSTNLCKGETTSINLNANLLNANFSWTVSGGSNITGASAGNGNTISQVLNLNGNSTDSVSYIVTSSANGCTAKDTITIKVSPCVLVVDTIAICSGSSANLSSPSVADSYAWTPAEGLSNPSIANPVATPSQTTQYEVRDGQGNLLGRTLVQVKNTPNVDLGNDKSICGGNQVVLDAGNAGATYVWNTGSTTQTINVNSVGTYFVTASFGDCSDTDTVEVSEGTPPVVNLGNDLSICGQVNITLSTGNAQTTWSTGETGPSIQINTPGTYWAQVTNDCGTSRDTIVVTAATAPTVNLGADRYLCEGFVTFDLSENNYPIVLWSNGSTLENISFSQPGVYFVSVGTSPACLATDTVNVFSCCTITDMPTAFTPNGDGKNDIYIVRGPESVSFETFKLVIYNRWGEKVFESNDIANGWNGEYQSAPAAPGVYGYYLEAVCKEGEKITKKGNLTLIR